MSMIASPRRASDSAKRPAEAMESERQKHLILMSNTEDCSRFDGIDPADWLRSKALDPTKATEDREMKSLDSVGEDHHPVKHPQVLPLEGKMPMDPEADPEGSSEELRNYHKEEGSIQCFTDADLVNWKYWRPRLRFKPPPPLSGYCGICKDLVNHIPLFCPNQIRRPGYCGVCKKEADHDTFHCPTFTQDQVEFFAFCQFCNENSYHSTTECPHAEFVYLNGQKIPNVCWDCHKTGHVFLDCPDADSEHSDDYL